MSTGGGAGFCFGERRIRGIRRIRRIRQRAKIMVFLFMGNLGIFGVETAGREAAGLEGQVTYP